MKKRQTPVMPATAEEEALIVELTATPVFDRFDRGELEIVDLDDWSDVPDLAETETLTVPAEVFRKLEAVSRKRHTTPERLAGMILKETLEKFGTK